VAQHQKAALGGDVLEDRIDHAPRDVLRAGADECPGELVEAPKHAVCPLAKQVDAADDGAAFVVCRQRPLGVEDHAGGERRNVARACQCVAHAFVADATPYTSAPLWKRRRWLMQARPWSIHRRGTRPSRYGTATHATPTHPMISINNADGIVEF